MLIENGQVMSYASRYLHIHEKKYPTHDLDFIVVVFMLKISTHYLFGSRFEVLSNQKSLKYLFDQKVLNMSQRMWLKFIKDYDLA